MSSELLVFFYLGTSERLASVIKETTGMVLDRIKTRYGSETMHIAIAEKGTLEALLEERLFIINQLGTSFKVSKFEWAKCIRGTAEIDIKAICVSIDVNRDIKEAEDEIKEHLRYIRKFGFIRRLSDISLTASDDCIFITWKDEISPEERVTIRTILQVINWNDGKPLLTKLSTKSRTNYRNLSSARRSRSRSPKRYEEKELRDRSRSPIKYKSDVKQQVYAPPQPQQQAYTPPPPPQQVAYYYQPPQQPQQQSYAPIIPQQVVYYQGQAYIPLTYHQQVQSQQTAYHQQVTYYTTNSMPPPIQTQPQSLQKYACCDDC